MGSAGKRETHEMMCEMWPTLVRYCRARVGSRSDSWEFADAMAHRVASAIPGEYRNARGTRPFRALVYSVAEQTLAPVVSSAMPGTSGPALNGLPETERVVLILRVIEGMSVGETAVAIGVPDARVRLAQHRALAQLNAQVA